MRATVSTNFPRLQKLVPWVTALTFCNITGADCNVTMYSNDTGPENDQKISTEGLIIVSLILWIVILIGIGGNLMVIYGVLSDRKMRASATNLFIINLAVADFNILLMGIPDTVMFSIDQGYLLGLVACKGLRYGMVLSYYASVMNQIALCIERYIAIVHPLKANILCNHRNTLIGIACIWPISALCAIPVAIFNLVGTPKNATRQQCATRFPGDHATINFAWKYAEMVMFYIAPMVLLIVLYCIVGQRLFVGVDELHGSRRDSDALQARRGVVKMLLASVILYFLSYSPIQVMLVYVTFKPFPLHKRWMWYAFVVSLVYVNSAANPILYSIFSQNFRRRFQRMVCFFNPKYHRKDRSASTVGSSCSQTGHISSNATTKYSLVHLNKAQGET